MAQLLEVRFNSTNRDCKQIIKIEKSQIGPSDRNNNENQTEKKTVNSGSDPVVEAKLEKVSEQVAIIDSKLSNLQQQLDTNSITFLPQDELVASASENYRVGIGGSQRLQALDKVRSYSKKLIIYHKTYK